MRLVEIAPTKDAVTGLPIAIIDTTVLDGVLPNEEQFAAALRYLPRQEHIIVFFASGVPKTPNLPWLIHSHRMVPRETKKSIRKIYVVNGTWWSKAAIGLLGGVLSAKFIKKIEHVKSISALAKCVDITALNLSPQVYLDNLNVEPSITIPKHCEPTFGLPVTDPRGTAIYKGCLRYLLRIEPMQYPKDAFQKTNGAPLVQVLVEAVQRGQLVNLGAFGPRHVIALLKFYLLELPSPLLDVNLVHAHKGSSAGLVDALQHPNLRALSVALDWLAKLHKCGQFTAQEMADSLGPAFGKLSLQGSKNDLDAVKQATSDLISDWLLTAPPMAEKPLPCLNAAKALKAVPDLAPREPRTQSAPTMMGRSRSSSPARSPTRTFKIQPLGDRPASSDNRQPLPKANMAAIRGIKIAQMVRTFEERLDEM